MIGALLAVHRTVRPFPPGEVALLTSFAAHAAVALENARLFERAGRGQRDELRQRSEAAERAAGAHDRLTDVLLHGGDVVEVADVLAGVLGGAVAVYDDERPAARRRRGAGDRRRGAVRPAPPGAACRPTTALGGRGRWPARSTSARSCSRTDGPMELPERRTLERGALVAALVLLFGRIGAEAEERLRGELLVDLLAGRRHPTGCASAPGRRGLGSTATGGVAVAEVDRRRPAPRRPGGRGAGRRAAGARRRARRPGGARRAGRRRAGRRWTGCTTGWSGGRPGHRATVGVSSRRPSGESAGGLARGLGVHSTRCCASVARGEVSDPAGLGFARLLLGDNGEAELDVFVRRTLGPVLDYDAERGTPGWSRPSRPGSTPAAGCARPRTPCTCTRTRSPSGWTGSAGCSVRTGGSRSAGSTCSWRCRWCGCAARCD